MAPTTSNTNENVVLEGVTKDVLQAEAPDLVSLLEICPELHIYTKSSQGFREAHVTLWGDSDVVSLAVVRPTTDDEVSATMRACSAANLKVAFRSGGNDVGDRFKMPGGVMLDMRSFDSITVAEDRKTATVGGAVTVGSMLAFLDKNDLDTPVGWCTTVGYTGWACSGGYGCSAGVRGLGVDQIISARVVDAHGNVVEASADGDTDAYWAVRGAGAGAIGAVTQLTIKLYPKPRVFGGYVMYPFAEIEKVFSGMGKLYAEKFPDNFSGDVFLIDPMKSGGLVNHFFYWMLRDDASDLDEAKAFLDRITSLGTVIMNTVAETTPAKFVFGIENPLGVKPPSGQFTTTIVRGFSAEFGAAIAPPATKTSVIVLHCGHGAATRPDPTAAFYARYEHIVAGIAASCPIDEDIPVDTLRTYSDSVLKAIENAGVTTGEKYRNFNEPEAGDGKMYLGTEGVEKLKKIKAKFDPMNMFAASTPDLGA